MMVLCDDLCLLDTSEVSTRSRSLPWYTLEGWSWYYIVGFIGLLVLCCIGIAVGHYYWFGTPERNNINLSIGPKRYNQLSMGENEIVDDFQDLPGVDDPKRVQYRPEEVKMKELQGEAIVKGFGDVISYTPHDKLLHRQSQEEMKRQTQSLDNLEDKRQEVDPRRVEDLMEKPSPPLNDQLGYNVSADQADGTTEPQNQNLQPVREQAAVPPALLPVPPVQSTVQRELVTAQEDRPRRHRRPKRRRDRRKRRRRHVSAR